MVVKSYESKSTVDKLKELEKIVFKTHSPLTLQEVMKNVEEYANTVYNQAIDDVLNVVEWDGYTLDIKERILKLRKRM